ncbi:elongation factor P hydroxylase [Psychrobacter sp. ANT_WB68]|uniref:elongation factor P hydroxylase n=1 Tax=Psychrobacter sp. ANT_WB68 TaxID=2597355 RepID=UPI0011F0E5B6|nr:elongation factor P hydroxylase [Psychrobacter sp. ANT_WB68]KAA0912770.1 elongation factor P hydroxylase [Psychrobacter sp. ANT_WB68]
MISPTIDPDFSHLLSALDAKRLLQRLNALDSKKTNNHLNAKMKAQLEVLSKQWLQLIRTQQINISSDKPSIDAADENIYDDNEKTATDWLISLFNTLFSEQKVILVRGNGEPEYFPAKDNQPARIEFAHGFFQSALHECSHWSLAGKERRSLSDFGYWYAPDGRTAAQQQAFERVEIKPQALECLFSLACGRNFRVSQDNLFANFDTSGSTFAHDVCQQAKEYIVDPQTLPRDAKTLLQALLSICSSD